MFPEVVDEVKGFIEARNFSVERFASLANVGESTMYRFFRGESISEKSLIAILRVIHGSNHGEVLKQLAERYPDNKDLQKSADFHKTLKSSFDVDEELKQFYTRDTISYQIYIVLTYEDGVSPEIIRDEFGKYGMKLFDELFGKNKLIEVKPGCYRLANLNQGFLDGEILRVLAGRVFELFQPDTFMTKESQITHLTGWTNEEGFAAMKDVELKAGLMVIDILNKYPGTIPFSVATGLIKIRDSINFKKNSEGLS